MASTAKSKHRVPKPKKSNTSALRRRIDKLEALLDVAKAMTAERDLDALLELILNEAVKVAEADRCSLWIVDFDTDELWTRVAQGLDKGQKIRIPMGVGIAGQVAQTGQVINIPDAYADTRFNRQVDKDTGYHTRHILGVPMRSTTGNITGVLQALNKLQGDHFTAEDEELLMALGANAAAAVENAILYEDIDKLFEGFVKASVTAIESRDPTTSGHSERVAILTLGIAENVDKLVTGPYKDVSVSRDDMRELRYAALLHDFGKVGVRENVLTKEKKLFPSEMALIESRFKTRYLTRENDFLRSLIESIHSGGTLPPDYPESLLQVKSEFERFLSFIRTCNEPATLEAETMAQLRDVSQLTFLNAKGDRQSLLSQRELERLSIPVGSLDADERLEIQSHVTHTFRFLSQIPWTRSLRRVPDFAYGHHERLDGSGYPLQLEGAQIPVQTRMMSIADIYDALTAHDRPYKPAVPHEHAIDVLVKEGSRGHVDGTLVRVFIDAKVHERVNSLPAHS